MSKNQSKKTTDPNTIQPTISEIYDASKGNETLSNKNQAATIDYENQLEMFPPNPNKIPPISEVNQNPEIYDRNSLFGSVNSNSYLHHLIPNIGPSSLFSGTDVEEFLEVYEIITRGLKGVRKVKLFTRYCLPSLTDEIKWTEEYEEGDWEKFCVMIKSRYKKKKTADPFKEINKLVSNGINSDNYETFFQNFNFLSNKLVNEDYITVRQKSELLLKSIPGMIIEKLSTEIVKNGEFISYQNLVKVISSYYVSEKRIKKFRNSSTNDENVLSSVNGNFKFKPEIIKINKKESSEDQINKSDTENEMRDLVKQMESMVLNINQKFLGDGKISASNDVSLGKNPVINTIERPIRCIYCDGFHQKRDCEILTEDLNKGLVKLDEKKSIILPNGIAIKPNYGNGGMKALLKPNIQSVNNNVVQVCANDSSYYVDERDYFSNEIQVNNDYLEIINEDEFEKIIESFGTKRKQEDIPLAELTSYKRISQESKKGDNMSKFNIPENKNDEILDLPYTMKSKIVKSELQDKVLQKCKQSLITLSLEEVASVSPLVRKSLNDDFRLKREIKVDTINSTDEDISNNNWKKKYLSVGSGRKKGLLQGVRMMCMFDEGSEINIMSESVFNGLKSLNRVELDTSLQWRMKDANAGSSNLLGVVKDALIEIEGIQVKTPVFVSTTTQTPLILGRPWEIKTRVIKENKNDGSLWYTLMDEITNIKATFCVSNVRDTRRIEDSKIPFDDYFNIESYKIEAIRSITDWGYDSNVMTRYKKSKDKMKPVSAPLTDYESPSIQEKDKELSNQNERLTDERVNNLVFGENLTEEEKSFFINELKKCDKAFSFSSNEMGLLSETIEKPVVVETIEHDRCSRD
ncbi:hypothetical protein AYI69_g5500 [Smittium culicis]|uniref:Uncharacterized protein n=1 Tax=Smittium culicis TaxID=133412 RepID=A0A1R1Y5P5_9FUNG|nr:hypothetical protein AYI69_g5500 [Smittium culicis]